MDTLYNISKNACGNSASSDGILLSRQFNTELVANQPTKKLRAESLTEQHIVPC
jgi:hypothetical protein